MFNISLSVFYIQDTFDKFVSELKKCCAFSFSLLDAVVYFLYKNWERTPFSFLGFVYILCSITEFTCSQSYLPNHFLQPQEYQTPGTFGFQPLL